ncbi:hypothetical protein GCM10008905_10060 [Clostridium malenominatum]|uniref:Uncharacterized protein n=1 Tax=Clostridium malenominatum TaxID=1539 RepID=A0ABN1ISQ5_9CLOT
MLMCPNCKSKIPFWKPWFLTNFNGINCSTCGKKLSGNKKINSLIGGIGGGLGTLVLLNLYKSNFSFGSVGITVLWILSVCFASSLFTKLEIKE